MKSILQATSISIVTAAILIVPMIAAAQSAYPGFSLLKVAELNQHDAELAKKIGADHSSRETIKEFGDHRIRLLLRDGDGAPESHANDIDFVVVHSGEGTLVLGGTLSGATTGPGGETTGGVLQGGERYALAPGDIIHIPAAVPHAFLPAKGKHLTYVLLKIPAVYPVSQTPGRGGQRGRGTGSTTTQPGRD